MTLEKLLNFSEPYLVHLQSRYNYRIIYFAPVEIKLIFEKCLAHGKHHLAKVLTVTITIIMVTLLRCVTGKLQRTGVSHVFLSHSWHRRIISA